MRRLSSTSSHTAKTWGGLPGFIFCTEVSKYNKRGTNKNFSEQVAGTIEARFRKPKSFIEQIGHRSFVIVPHEVHVIPKGTAPCTNSAACAALAQFGDSLEKFF